MILKELRKKEHKTQQELAKYLNVSRPTYNGYELGTIKLTAETLIELAKYYHVSIDYLCGYQTPYIQELGYLDEKTLAILKLTQQLTDKNKDQAFYYISGLVAGQ